MNREPADRPAHDHRRPPLPRGCPVPPPGPAPAAPRRLRPDWPEWADWTETRGGVDVCDRCRAFGWACFCEAAPDRLARFARRIAELHPPAYPGGCGCGTHRCAYRQRLDDIQPPGDA